MRPIRPVHVAAWMLITFLAFGPDVSNLLPNIPISLSWVIGASAPFKSPDGKLYVLLVDDDQTEEQRTAGQRLAMQETKTGGLRDYVLNTAKGDWRVFDDNDDVTRETQVWQDAMKAWQNTKTKPPGMAVSNGRTGYVGEMPAELSAIKAKVGAK